MVDVDSVFCWKNEVFEMMGQTENPRFIALMFLINLINNMMVARFIPGDRVDQRSGQSQIEQCVRLLWVR